MNIIFSDKFLYFIIDVYMYENVHSDLLSGYSFQLVIHAGYF